MAHGWLSIAASYKKPECSTSTRMGEEVNAYAVDAHTRAERAERHFVAARAARDLEAPDRVDAEATEATERFAVQFGDLRCRLATHANAVRVNFCALNAHLRQNRCRLAATEPEASGAFHAGAPPARDPPTNVPSVVVFGPTAFAELSHSPRALLADEAHLDRSEP